MSAPGPIRAVPVQRSNLVSPRTFYSQERAMDRSTRSTPLHLQSAPQQLLGRPLTLVLVSVLSIANAGVFAASVAWPLRSRADVAPTTAIQKSNAVTLSRRLKGDRLAEPNITGEW